MRAVNAALYRPPFCGNCRLQRDVLGDLAFQRETGMLEKGFTGLLALLRKAKRSLSARPRLIRRLGQHSLYLWQIDPEKVWEGRNVL